MHGLYYFHAFHNILDRKVRNEIKPPNKYKHFRRHIKEMVALLPM